EMRVSNLVHQARPWVINRIAPDFELLDAWELPIEGTLEDFDAAVRILEGFDPIRSAPLLTRVLFRLRFWVGQRLGWDDQRTALVIPSSGDSSHAERIPPELRGSAARAAHGSGSYASALKFVPSRSAGQAGRGKPFEDASAG